MIATSGAALADDATIAAFGQLMDLATVTTPNLPELTRLTGKEDPVEGALGLVSKHRCAVLVKGGHDEGEAVADALIEEDNLTSWQGTRIDTEHSHGTGCTLASAIAFGLGEGRRLADAVAQARNFVRLSLLEAPGLGQGHGPMGQGQVRLDVGGSPRLNQVTVTGRDYAKQVAFYRKLGLRQIVDSPVNGYARFEAWGGTTFSVQIDPEEEIAPTTAIYFECDDLDSRVEALARSGLVFEHGPRDQPWLWREARLRDPAGNIIFLYRAGEARRFPPWRMAEG
jgi:hydroxymethylpyrimidine/phosphomethylpyrimidine kinase